MQVCVDINELIFIGLDNPDCDHLFEFVPKEFIDEAEKINIVRCRDCKYNPENPRLYADNDVVAFYSHCGHLGDDGFCSLGKPEESEEKK